MKTSDEIREIALNEEDYFSDYQVEAFEDGYTQAQEDILSSHTLIKEVYCIQKYTYLNSKRQAEYSCFST